MTYSSLLLPSTASRTDCVHQCLFPYPNTSTKICQLRHIQTYSKAIYHPTKLPGSKTYSFPANCFLPYVPPFPLLSYILSSPFHISRDRPILPSLPFSFSVVYRRLPSYQYHTTTTFHLLSDHYSGCQRAAAIIMP